MIGAITLSRRDVRIFSEKHIDLVKSFAAQAVIAIENARLLNELRQRTDDLSQRTTDLTEALEWQTATSDVLQVISSSPGDLEPVFATMLEKAVRICGATFGNVYRWQDGALHLVAAHNTPSAFVEYRRRSPLRPDPTVPFGRMVKSKISSSCRRPCNGGSVCSARSGIRRRSRAGRRKDVFGSSDAKRRRTCRCVRRRPARSSSLYRETDRTGAELRHPGQMIAIENARLLTELREQTVQVVKLNQQLGQRVADRVGEIERMGDCARFLPPQVADLIVASGTGRATRKSS